MQKKKMKKKKKKNRHTYIAHAGPAVAVYPVHGSIVGAQPEHHLRVIY